MLHTKALLDVKHERRLEITYSFADLAAQTIERVLAIERGKKAIPRSQMKQ